MAAHSTWNTPVTAALLAQSQPYLERARALAQSGPEWPAAPATVPDKVLAVIGAGTMGTGIALAGLAAGLDTLLLDADEAALQRGMDRIHSSLEGAVQRGRLAADAAAQRQRRLRPGTNWQALEEADVVIEAVYENLAVKQELMARLHASCPPHTLLVSNTSTLDIDAMALASGRPAQVLGMHFLTPAHLTPLVEVVRGAATAPQSLVRAKGLAERMGKLAVQTANAWGFIGNAMFEGYLREVDALQLQGVAADRIDRALESFGFALGPCRTLDMAGTDLVSQVLAERALRFPQPPDYRRVTCRLSELGRYGHKTGHGHYLYEGRSHRPDPDLARVCTEEAARLGIAQLPGLDDSAIVERCVQPLIDEGRRLLAQGVACRASDIDLVWVLGYGFPAARGGPMLMAGLAGY